MKNNAIRNIGIIAHVDHGKTTLVDALLQRAGIFEAHREKQERAMDSMDLEREKGITIKAKNCAVEWQDTKINIVDTPGHADFGGEVERILKMVDGVLLLVDAAEGPQAQTRFVLRKAIENELKLVVMINKIDRPQANPERAHDQVLELLMELHANEEQFNAPFLYGSAKNGFAVLDPEDQPDGMDVLLDAIIEHIPPPDAIPDAHLQVLVSNLDWNDYVGRIAIGRINSGNIKLGDSIVCIHGDGTKERKAVSKLYTFSGLGMTESTVAEAGDIIGVAGFDTVFIGETLCDSEEREPLPFVEIDPPTIQMQFWVNDGPFAGQDGKYVTSRHIGDRLKKETRINISLQVEEVESAGNVFNVSARGELQIAVLAETMRREGYEVLISRPQVIYKQEEGQRLEPIEQLWMDIPNNALGDIMQLISNRKGNITHMQHEVGDRVLLEAEIPTRGLIGLESIVVNLTAGEAVMSHIFLEYRPYVGQIPSRNTGSLVSVETGPTTAYALNMVQERGRLFVGPGQQVYEGMIVGENARNEDLPVNPIKTKQLTNVRASGSDKSIILEPPVVMNLERAIEFIADDEFVEATPNHLRLRKKILDPHERKRARKRDQL